MKLLYKAFSTVLVQSVGVIAVLLVTLIVTNKYGIAAQGYYNYSRSIIELFATIITFGFPQSFVYAINNKIVTVQWTVVFSVKYIFTVLLLSSTFIFLQSVFPLRLVFDNSIPIIFASVALALHSLVRAIVLTRYSNIIFNAVTIAPSIFLLLSVAIFQITEYQQLIFCIVTANVGASLFSMTIFRKEICQGKILSVKLPFEAKEKKKIIFIGKYGFWTFIQPFLSQSSLAFCYFILQKESNGDSMSGHFGIAMLFLSFAILPLNMLIPVLFDHWSKCEFEKLRETYQKFSFIGLLLSISIGALLVLSNRFMLSFLDIYYQKYKYTFSVIQVLLWGIYPCYQSRLLTALMLSQNNPLATCIASFIRVVSIVFLFVVGLPGSGINVAWACNFGEFIGMLYLMFVACQKYKQSIFNVVGIRNFKIL